MIQNQCSMNFGECISLDRFTAEYSHSRYPWLFDERPFARIDQFRWVDIPVSRESSGTCEVLRRYVSTGRELLVDFILILRFEWERD